MDRIAEFLLSGFGIIAALIALYLFVAHPEAVANETKAIGGGFLVPVIAQLQGNPGK